MGAEQPVTRRKPANERASIFLAKIVEQTRASGRTRLSALPELAAQAGVSRSTMQRAVAALCRSGVLTARPGRGIEIAVDAREQVSHRRIEGLRAVRRVDSVRAAMERDILGGKYRRGERLPLTKLLSTAYGTSTRCVRETLSELFHDRLLTRSGGRYVVADINSGAFRGAITLIARGNIGDLIETSPWSMRCFELLEAECARSGVTLETCPLCYFDGRLQFPSELVARFDTPDKGLPLLGFLFFPAAVEDHIAAKVMSAIGSTGKPAAILDDEEVEPISRAVEFVARSHPGIARFSISTTVEPGRRIGEHLLNLGHRRAAYVSLHHEQPYSVHRLWGLTDAFSRAGLTNAVTAVTIDGYQPPADAEVISMLHSKLSASIGIDKQALGDEHERSMRIPFFQVRQLSYRVGMHPFLQGMLSSTLAERDITAWVAENDIIALQMLDFLATHGKRVPEDISVTGFDNTGEAFVHHLTSYDFNGEAAVRSMLAHVLDPSSTPGRRGFSTPIEIPGFIAARKTTGSRQ